MEFAVDEADDLKAGLHVALGHVGLARANGVAVGDAVGVLDLGRGAAGDDAVTAPAHEHQTDRAEQRSGQAHAGPPAAPGGGERLAGQQAHQEQHGPHDRAGRDRAHVVVVADAGHDELGPLGGFAGGRGGAARVLARPDLGLGGGAVPDRHLVPGRRQMARTGELTVEVVDMLANIKPLKTMNRYAPLLASLQKTIRRLQKSLNTREIARQALVQGGVNFIQLLDPEYPQKAFLKRDAGVEQFVTAEPDLVLLKSSQAEKYGAPIEALKIPVIYLDFETPDQYARDLNVLGQIFGDEARAQELNQLYQGAVDEINQKVPAEAAKPSVLVLQYSDTDGAVAFGVPPAGWMQTKMVELAGGRPVWKEANPGKGWAQVTIEQIAAWNPDLILVVSYKQDPGKVTASLKEDPKWQLLRAVKNGSLYGFPKDIYSWDQPDTRWLLGLEWLASRLHPGQFGQVDMLQKARDFYQSAYGLDAASYDAHLLPITQGDIH